MRKPLQFKLNGYKMWKRFCETMLKWLGWEGVGGIMPHKKAIIIGAPHTSAWDFVLSYLYYTAQGGKAHVIIKKEFFFWPMGPILRKMGGIPVDRSKGSRIVKQIIDEFERRDSLHLAITPEGTRKPTKRWKAGFHTIAKATGATVYIGFFDFGKKQIGWRETLELSDDSHADIKRLKAYYRDNGIKGKYPEMFCADD